MPRSTDIALTALAPAIWGSSYLVATEFLPQIHPMHVALLRALPAGLLLLLLVRQLPTGHWWPRIFLLGALNFSIFWSLLFVAAYRLPGGVAATVGAVQPLAVVFIARYLLDAPIRLLGVVAALSGLAGVAVLILGPDAQLDPVGVIAGLGGALSMAFGTVLSRKWRPDVSSLTFTAWQLAAGGLLLLPVVWIWTPALPHLDTKNLIGLFYLGGIGAAATYVIWLRGIARIAPAAVSMLGFLSPVTAVTLGWLVLDQRLAPMQIGGAVIVLGSVWLGQIANRPRGESLRTRVQTAPSPLRSTG